MVSRPVLADWVQSWAPAVTGTLVAAGIAYPWGFYVFAAAAVLAVATLVTVPHAISMAPAKATAVGS